MTELLKTGIEYINYLTSGNEMATGLLVAGIGSILALAARGTPKVVGDLMLKYFTTTITINSKHSVYYDIMRHLDNTNVVDKSRFLSLSSGVYGFGKAVKVFGQGTQIVELFGIRTFMQIEEIRLNDNIIHNVKLRTIGRSHTLADRLKEESEKDNEVGFYNVNALDNYVTYKVDNDLIAPILSKENEELVEHILTFENRRDEYKKFGIPFNLGVLMHGEPGNGKTRLIRYLENELAYNVYVCNNLSDFEKAPTQGKLLIILEEFDGMLGGKRKDDDDDKLGGAIQGMVKANNVNGFLKVLDGVLPVDGRIVIASTNFPDDLDPAIVRKGRFDIQIEINNPSVREVLLFSNRFYGTNLKLEDFTNYKSMDYSSADIQGAFLEGLTKDEFLNEFLQKI